MDTDDIFDQLTEALGGFVGEVTGRPVLLGKEGVWNKPDGNFVLVDLQAADAIRWETGIGHDAAGNEVYAHNFVVTFLVTAFRGKAHSALSKVVQRFNTPFIYYKYFPTDSPFTYSSCSSVSRTRVPMEEQQFENQSSVILNFNVCFVEADGSFEEVEEINIHGKVQQPGGGAAEYVATASIVNDIASQELYVLVNEDLPLDGKSTWINTNN